VGNASTKGSTPNRTLRISEAIGLKWEDVRRSVTLPPEVAHQVDTIAKRRRLSDNRVFRGASDPEPVKRLGDQLGRFMFGE
jgi:hypothetical protein